MTGVRENQGDCKFTESVTCPILSYIHQPTAKPMQKLTIKNVDKKLLFDNYFNIYIF